MADSLTQQDILRVVNKYIGVSGGYLGDFTYRLLSEFYPEYCGFSVNTDRYDGTIRQRFIAILGDVEPRDQARVLRGVLSRFPVGGEGAPPTRTPALKAEVEALVDRLEGAAAVAAPSPKVTSEVLDRAIADAETLLRTTGATSGVDRVHTALHGHLIAVCDAAGIVYQDDPSATQLYKLIREQHPDLAPAGPRAEDVGRVLKMLAAVIDALQPVRNRASVAHPNKELLAPAEAMLAINAARTILHYIDSKIRN
jgi:hypothetical protein